MAENPCADHSHPSRPEQPGELGDPRYILRADRPQEFLGLVGRSDPNPLVLTELGAALAFWAGYRVGASVPAAGLGLGMEQGHCSVGSG